MEFNYHHMESWPPLAWLARCQLSSHTVDILHGERVEIKDSWFCEGIWDGPFESGGFDRTDNIFGSGGRIREGRITFVSSGTTVDRLQAIQVGGSIFVSNSLPCLLSMVDGKVDPTNPDYYKFFESIITGLKDYQRQLETLAGQVYFVYFHNVTWDGSRLVEVEKPRLARCLHSFHAYRDFLNSTIECLSKNLSSTLRKFPYRMTGTLSSGYDSPTAVVLAKSYGLTEVISFISSRSGNPDDGAKIAEILGVDITFYDRNGWKDKLFAEIPFLSSDAKGEDVFFCNAEEQLIGKVLITGFHGDKVWEKTTSNLEPYIVRGDQSGLSLTEYRLWVGFIHLPIPFLGVQQIQDINAISWGEEMKPWDIGGTYNRPICRRIVEEAGVLRSDFGVSKKAASVIFNERRSFLSEKSRESLYCWLQIQARLWWKKGQLPPLWVRRLIIIMRPFLKLAALVSFGLRVIGRVVPKGVLSDFLKKTQKKFSDFDRREYLFRYAFPWALERSKERYRAHSTFVKIHPDQNTSTLSTHIHLLNR